MNEAALVCEAQRGSQTALQHLLTQNWAWLRAIVYNVLRNPSDLDDVLQEIAIRVIRKIDTLREPECFRSWLAAVARREALRFRQQQPRGVSLDDDRTPVPPLMDTEDASAESELKDQVDQIMAAVGRLPEKYREVFLLQHSQCLSYREIAEVLDVPLTTVQIRLVRARRMILEMLTASENHRSRSS